MASPGSSPLRFAPVVLGLALLSLFVAAARSADPHASPESDRILTELLLADTALAPSDGSEVGGGGVSNPASSPYQILLEPADVLPSQPPAMAGEDPLHLIATISLDGGTPGFTPIASRQRWNRDIYLASLPRLGKGERFDARFRPARHSPPGALPLLAFGFAVAFARHLRHLRREGYGIG
jgi:hypothetical protein